MTAVSDGHLPALLWDLDNVTPSMRDLPGFASLILALSGPTCARYAAGTRSVSRAARPILEPLGFTVLSGGRRNNGADQALLQQARRLQQQGAVRFIVASNDHAFARLEPPVQLRVLTRNAAYVSVRLRERANMITTIHAPAVDALPRLALPRPRTWTAGYPPPSGDPATCAPT